MVIPSKEHHISEKKAAELKETTDLLGMPLKVGDQCMVFCSHERSMYSGIKDTDAMWGVVADIEVFPTLLASVTVRHYEHSEEQRAHKDYITVKDDKTTEKYYNTSILGSRVLREAMPEYFL